MMEKRVLLAGILSAIFFAVYVQTMLPQQRSNQAPEATGLVGFDGKETEAPAAEVVVPPKVEDYVPQLSAKSVRYLENDHLRLELGQDSGIVREVELKNFESTDGVGNQLIGGARSLFSVSNRSRNLQWSFEKQSASEISYRVVAPDGDTFRVVYGLEPDKPVFDLLIERLTGSAQESDAWILASTWERASEKSRYNRLEAHFRYEKDPGGKLKFKKFGGPLKQVEDVPRGTLISTLTEGFFCQAVDYGKARPEVQALSPSENLIAAVATVPIDDTYKARIYLGPRDFFHMRDASFKDALKVGIVGQLGLMLLALLSGIAGITQNYGVAIILFSAIITGLLAPFTLMSYRSMRKMQELQPQIQKIMDKHKDDPTKANQQVFAIYKEHKVSPVGGCLPMLLQWPILIALFQGISHFIELRGESFLWIKDLSQPDHLAALPFSLPFLGDYFNALPLLMAGAMYLQTKANSKNMPSAQNNPTANFMQGPIFPLTFGLMLYNSPSGLILYWMMNSLMAMMLYRFAKK